MQTGPRQGNELNEELVTEGSRNTRQKSRSTWFEVTLTLAALAFDSARLNGAANQMWRCIWAKLYCLSSSSTAQLWAHPCQLAPPWISTMWKGRGSRRYEVRFWANSDWRVLRTPSDRAKSRIRSKHCTTAPKSYWRSSGGIGSKVAVRTTLRQSTMQKRFTNSTWSTERQKAVSTPSLQPARCLFPPQVNANNQYVHFAQLRTKWSQPGSAIQQLAAVLLINMPLMVSPLHHWYFGLLDDFK